MTRAPGVEERGAAFVRDVQTDTHPTEFLFNTDLMGRMDELGLFESAGRRIELRAGRLVKMAPTGIDHGDSDGFVHRELWKLVTEIGDVELKVVSATITLSNDEAPVPDAMVVRGRPTGLYYPASSAELVVETAVSSLDDDLGPKRESYGRAGVREYWVLAPQRRELHVFLDPFSNGYRSESLLKPGDRVSPLFAEGRGEIAVADLF